MDNIGSTTELFLVNMRHDGGGGYKGYGIEEGDWVCFRSTHSLMAASDMAGELLNAGHEVCVQSIRLDSNGKVEL